VLAARIPNAGVDGQYGSRGRARLQRRRAAADHARSLDDATIRGRVAYLRESPRLRSRSPATSSRPVMRTEAGEV